jgi:hypothetical protein
MVYSNGGLGAKLRAQRAVALDAQGALPGWVTVLVSVQRPSAENLKEYNRSEKHKVLTKNAVERREALLNWIKRKGLQSEIKRVGAPTLFNMLTVICTPRVAELLSRAPGVTNVVTTPEAPLNIDVIRQ